MYCGTLKKMHKCHAIQINHSVADVFISQLHFETPEKEPNDVIVFAKTCIALKIYNTFASIKLCFAARY